MKGKWRTKAGVVMNIHDMETSHIQNTIKMLERGMPSHEHDEVIVADFPESMDWQPCHYTEAGAKTYREKIAELTQELKNRNELQ